MLFVQNYIIQENTWSTFVNHNSGKCIVGKMWPKYHNTPDI